MNKKGFTLTELIVSIAIMGVILIIAFPSITNLSNNNKKELYSSYESVLETGAKLYVDKYGRDLWTSSNCEKITYQALKDENLIKDFIGKGKEEVSLSKTAVYAKKNGNQVEYTVSFVTTTGTKTTYNNYKNWCS